MQTNLSETMYSFYDHNSPLIFLGGMTLVCLLVALKNGSRKYILMFIAFFILTFKFEYDKHLFSKIKTDMLDLIFPPDARHTKYSLIRVFLDIYLPILMDIAGWGLLAIVFLFDKKPKEEKITKL